MSTKNYLTLANGAKMPQVGLGIFQVPPKDTAELVYNAIKIGYRLIDGAYDYQNEAEAGQGVRRAIDEGLVKREDLFIVSKLWNHYHERERALETGRAQVKAWGLEYLDLYLIHFPVALKWVDPKVKKYAGWYLEDGKTTETSSTPIQETWQAIETFVDEGIVKALGVSNFQGQGIYDILRYAKHPICALQIEHHPYLTQPDLISLCQDHNIAVMAYCSFGPMSFSNLPGKFSKRATDAEPLFKLDKVTKIAEAHSKTPAQVLLRWATQRGLIVIPKSSSTERLKENFDVVNFDLTKEEIGTISGLDIGLRFNDPGFYLETPLRIFA